jgi:hypothetical protein
MQISNPESTYRSCLCPSTPHRNTIMDSPIFAFSDVVRPSGFPVQYSLEAISAGCSQGIAFHQSLVIVRDIFARMAEVLQICL